MFGDFHHRRHRQGQNRRAIGDGTFEVNLSRELKI
jgi:hypothetical protein